MTMMMSETAWREAEDERTSAPWGGYPNAMAQEAAWYHAQGMPCPFDCARCQSIADDYDDYDETPATPAPVVRCGHCHGYHTVEGVRACSTIPR